MMNMAAGAMVTSLTRRRLTINTCTSSDVIMLIKIANLRAVAAAHRHEYSEYAALGRGQPPPQYTGSAFLNAQALICTSSTR